MILSSTCYWIAKLGRCSRKELLKEYRINFDHYKELIDLLYDEILKKSNYEMTSTDLESMGEKIEREKYKKMREIFASLKESHLF